MPRRLVTTRPRAWLLLALLALLGLLAAAAAADAEAQSPNDGASVQLQAGGNLIAYLGPTSPVDVALNDALIYADVVWSFDAPQQAWALWSPALPAVVQGIQELIQNNAYFVFVSQAVTWNFPFLLPQSCAEQVPLRAQQGGSFPIFFFVEPVEFVGNAPAVCSVDRDLAGQDLIAESLQAMLAGPTTAEAAFGIASRWDGVTSGDSTCGGADFTMELSGGLATVQFCRSVILTGVVADAIMATQIDATLTAWPDIDRVAVLNQNGDCLFDLSGLNLCLAQTPASAASCISDIRDRPISDTGEDSAEFFTTEELSYASFPDLDGDGVRERVSHLLFLQNRQITFYLSSGGCTEYAGTMLGVYADPLATSSFGVLDLMTDATCGMAGLCRTLTTWHYDGQRYQPGETTECLGQESDPAGCPFHELEE